MAGGYDIYSIYKTDQGRFFVFRTVRPEFNNASQSDDDDSWETESAERKKLIEKAGKFHNQTGFERIGELQDCPIGEVFYEDFGRADVAVFYMETESGKPWVVLGSASSEEDFLAELSDDDDLQALKPIGNPIKIDACFITQNDFQP